MDRWRSGEAITADKLNNASAAVQPQDIFGADTFVKEGGRTATAIETVTGAESFWVTLDEEKAYTAPLVPSRTLYKYSWTEVVFDPLNGYWMRNTAHKGHHQIDPIMMADPTTKVLGSTAFTPDLGTQSSAIFGKFVDPAKVFQVVREPMTGTLFFCKKTGGSTGDCPPSGIYTAYFAALPEYYMFTVPPGSQLPPRYLLYNKRDTQGKADRAQCGLFSRHVTQVLKADGSVYYTKEYDASNPLVGTVAVPLPDNTYTIKYTVYTDDGKILQEFSGGTYLFPGDTFQSPAQDIKYIACPFTEFSAGLYGQIKYICNGLATPTFSVSAPTGTAWPAPSYVKLKRLPATLNIKAQLRIGPRTIQSDAEWTNANALLTGLNNLIADATIAGNAVNMFGPRNDFPLNGSDKLLGQFVVSGTTWYVYGGGSCTQAFAQTPLNNTIKPFDCSTSTISGFLTSAAQLRCGNSFTGGSVSYSLGSLVNNSLGYAASVPDQSFTPLPTANALFKYYNTDFFLVNIASKFA